MNIALEQTEEYVDGQLKARYGDCFIRGNNGESTLYPVSTTTSIIFNTINNVCLMIFLSLVSHMLSAVLHPVAQLCTSAQPSPASNQCYDSFRDVQ